MNNYLTYLYLLTPLHTGGSANEGNLMGIAREVHTEFPYLPASSLRGKIRAELESTENEVEKKAAGRLFGEKIQNGNQPTEGAIWFADATLLFFPIASLSHHLIWITCPMWLERWNRWLPDKSLSKLIQQTRTTLAGDKTAIATFKTDQLYLQTARLKKSDLEILKPEDCNLILRCLDNLVQADTLLTQLRDKLLILTDEDGAALVELGLQREVRVALENNSKTVKGGSFRSEEAIPPETVLFFPWGMKPLKTAAVTPQKSDITPQEAEAEAKKRSQETLADTEIRTVTCQKLNTRLQFGGLEGLGRGWSELKTINLPVNEKR